MFNRFGIIAFSVPLLYAAACFAQSPDPNRLNLKPGATVKLRANGTGAASYQWFRNGEAILGATLQDYVVNAAGKYTVITFSSGGCSSDRSEEMEVVMEPRVLADVSIIKRSESRQVTNTEVFKYNLLVRNNGLGMATNLQVKDELPENLIFVSVDPANVGAVNYNQQTKTVLWTIPSLANGSFVELIINVRSVKPGKVINRASVTINETDPDLSNNVSIDNKDVIGLKIPNVFTPNGDGKNETFFIEGLDLYNENQLTIINRWGSTVYEKKGYLNDWTADGLTDGTYFYVIRVKTANTQWQEFKGYVTVMR
ncbi:conserved repeat domain-containing protein/gliding motility-associated C-terminal domain-containing protein [Pedobacter suwonensis]|uniref:Conserved repeat domain-containing protein/gliding motility-associated C-terminal domain-containing protein n=1 Tax=Pedobacter suwonensis TaxID=332999 RepID=A0A1I0T569_9SPHI|nr:gliding motility-associated C-terminal domain-containing protein [Pedobacter suwonensis]SFA46899.1 conserved repeat domain-containing protein/gliding motility-associated C-terminal domain-containing protein [Pedobacter suwonensis]